MLSITELAQQMARIMDADGSDRKQLTDDEGIDGYPSVSPDGGHVVFASTREGGGIYRVDIDGGTLVRLAGGLPGRYSTHFSPDGRWVYYAAVGAGENVRTLWRVPTEGGDPARDGKQLALARGTQTSDVITISDFK